MCEIKMSETDDLFRVTYDEEEEEDEQGEYEKKMTRRWQLGQGQQEDKED